MPHFYAMTDTILISSAEMHAAFTNILLRNGFEKEKAHACATVFTANSVDGVYTHGVNRFPRFIQYVQEGFVKPAAEPELKHRFGGIEQWDGNIGPGPLNAIKATERAMQLSSENGIGSVAMANTNHWMRGGYYGWQAAKKGFVFIGWTNTIANMPAWNAVDNRLGNNPLVMALPYKDEAIVMDMAVSQFSYGAMEQAQLKQEELSVIGGFDKNGELTKNPSLIIESNRALPVGFWKGAGLSLLLDILAAVLSGGLSTHEISRNKIESAVSQVFVCIDLNKLSNHSSIPKIIESIIADYHQSISEKGKRISFPGEGTLHRRNVNAENGIPVLKKVWDEIREL